jgi:serine phosphatase RsbU (regulator of sigma subunit)
MAHPDFALRRMLPRDEVGKLLRDFSGLFVGGDLALVGPDGHVFAGTGSWPPSDLEALLAQVHSLDFTQDRAGDVIEGAGLFLAPLSVSAQLVGALVGRSPAPDRTLSGLRRSLTMLLTQALETREMARETLDRYRELNLLLHTGKTIGTRLDPEEIPRLELEEIGRVVRADASAVCLEGADSVGQGVLAIKASTGDAAEVRMLEAAGQELIAEVYGGGRADIRVLAAGPGQPFGALLCAPLRTQDRIIGVTLLGRRAAEPMFTASDEKLVVALADQSGIAIERAWLHRQEIHRQRMLEELALGRRIQLSLLPQTTPVIPGWEFAAVYRSANDVGGDYYDFLKVAGAPQRLGLVIADITDKGLPAALMMASARAILRTQAIRGRRPATVLRQANQWLMQDSRTGVFMTAFYAVLDTSNGELIYASGGHDRPLWLRAATGESQEVRVPGMILGAFPEIDLEEGRIRLEPGDALVCYTDGVTDVQNAGGDFFGVEGLQKILRARARAGAAELLEAIVSAAREFAGEMPQPDDFTMFVVKRAAIPA